MKNIVVVGTGYVGIVTGTCLADTGNSVICVDKNPNIINTLWKGESHIYEPGLSDLLTKNIEAKRITFTTSLTEAMTPETDLVIIAVGTPSSDDGSTNLSYVESAAKEIGETIAKQDIRKKILVMNKSTVPVGTAERVQEMIVDGYFEAREDISVAALGRPGLDSEVVSCPEFLREGSAIEDFIKADRIVIGCKSEYAKNLLTELFLPFTRNRDKIIIMDPRSAELTKYAANSMAALKISFMNEIANLCERLGADVELIRKGIGADHRIGPHNIYPGIGWGGSCFGKDVKSLQFVARENGYNPRILTSIIDVNYDQREIFADKVIEHLKSSPLTNMKIAVWGLSFKPNTDDVRDAPSIDVMKKIVRDGCDGVVSFTAYDAISKTYDNFIRDVAEIDEFKSVDMHYVLDQYEALEDADILLIFNESMCFRNPDFNRIVKYMKDLVIFDGRNLYNPEKMKEMGFKYYSIGREFIE